MALHTTFTRNDAYAIEASAEGVRIRFKKRVALPLLTAKSARSLAALLIDGAKESERYAKLIQAGKEEPLT